MCTLKPLILDCLSIIGKLGVANVTSKKEQVESSTKKVYKLLGISRASSGVFAPVNDASSSCCSKKSLAIHVQAILTQMLAPIQNFDEVAIIECGCLSAVLLHQLVHHTNQCDASLASLQAGTVTPPREKTAPAGIISISHRKICEDCCCVSLHTAVLACLDEEARLYPKMSLAKRKAVIGGRVLELPPSDRHSLLKTCMALILPVYKHSQYGVGIRNNLTGEVLTAALQLCFAPSHSRDYPADCGHFRLELEELMNSVEATVTLRHLLLLRGIAGTGQHSSWLLPTCTSLCVRRYLLAHHLPGVRMVVRAGLDLADGDDWRQCEAVASLVSRARVRDVEAFYRVVAPQVAHVLASDECKQLGGGVLRVMSIMLSQLMQRSPTLTMRYLARPLLLRPLLDLTTDSGTVGEENDKGASATDSSSLLRQGNEATERDQTKEEELNKTAEKLESTSKPLWGEGCCVERCVSVLYRSVVCGGGGEGGAAVLTPVLCPLLSVAAVPPPCRARIPATNCIVKHLSNSPNSACVQKLLVLAGLRRCQESPAMREDVRLTIDSDGGVTAVPYHKGDGGVDDEDDDVEVCLTNFRENRHKSVMKQDEHTVDAIIRVLAQLKNPTVVRNFFAALPKYLNFTRKTQPITNLLLTVADIISDELKSIRVALLVVELLTNMSEHADLLDDVFGSVADSVPLLLGMLTATAQPCNDENLQRIQNMLLLNVLLLLRRVVGSTPDGSLMTSSDWTALQALVPVLRRLQSAPTTNEAHKYYLEQVLPAILTRGAVTDFRSADEVLIDQRRFDSVDSIVRDITERDTRQATVGGRDPRKKCKRETSKVSNKSRVALDEDDDDEDCSESEVLDERLSSDANVYNPMLCSSDTSSESPSSTLARPSTATSASLSSVTSSDTSCNNDNSTQLSDFTTALEEVCSPLVPVRGHALLSLARLLDAGHPDVKYSKAKLLALFEHGLMDEDSYIYLMAVEGMAALCDAFPEKVVPVVCSGVNGSRPVLERIKLTEVLTRVARRLGPLLLQHKNVFLNTLLNGVRSDDPLMRAACLSSLGEVCKELRFSVGPIAQEIMQVVTSVVECDDAPEPRRAGVLLVTLMLRGLGTDAIQVLRDVLAPLYRALKLLGSRHQDELTRVHAQVALEELDVLTRDFVLPKLNPTKTIYVTQPPPKLF